MKTTYIHSIHILKSKVSTYVFLTPRKQPKFCESYLKSSRTRNFFAINSTLMKLAQSKLSPLKKTPMISMFIWWKMMTMLSNKMKLISMRKIWKGLLVLLKFWKLVLALSKLLAMVAIYWKLLEQFDFFSSKFFFSQKQLLWAFCLCPIKPHNYIEDSVPSNFRRKLW